MTHDAKRLGEFELIAKYFAPLAGKEAGAFGLKDDAAYLRPTAGKDLVLTTDAIVAGVHFLPGDPANEIAQKALRVNISDLAAKGATPRVYLLTLALPPAIDEPWLKSFAAGLKRDQAHFGVTLVGGDTVATPGPLTISVTAIGEVPQGHMLTRAGAQLEDDIWVSGTIGDAALGLRVGQGELVDFDDKHRATVLARYRVPEPRLKFGMLLHGIAHACLDVSDGLIADLGHMSEQSGLGVIVEAGAVPLSAAARAATAAKRMSLSELLTGGDDYELVVAAPVSRRKRIMALAERTKTKLSRIGRTTKGREVLVMGAGGERLNFERRGFTHF
ncbi:MAG: thiamine-phosphate kinase [Alphaproteobacteria bacterium]|nr:thiamine-phosphate kinase [Alphaproteobacteria bacterium]